MVNLLSCKAQLIQLALIIVLSTLVVLSILSANSAIIFEGTLFNLVLSQSTKAHSAKTSCLSSNKVLVSVSV